MIEIRAIKATDYMHTVKYLMTEHWQETEPWMPAPQPHEQVYRDLEKAGLLVAFGAFDGDRMIGYATAILTVQIHYSRPYAHHDLLFVSKDYRKGSLGLRLFSAVNEACKERGADFITWTAKPDTVFESILQKFCQVEEVKYRLMLGGEIEGDEKCPYQQQ